MSRDARKAVFGVLTRSDANRAAQLMNMARDWRFQIKEVLEFYDLCSENKGTDQLPSCPVTVHLVFAYARTGFLMTQLYWSL